jgi:hypothetical protein
VVDPHSGDRDCAGYWPASAGWHTVVAGAARIPFRVRATGEAPGLARAATRDATRLLAGNTDGTAAIASRDRPMPRWPFFLAWLVASAALWWIERRLRVAPERA